MMRRRWMAVVTAAMLLGVLWSGEAMAEASGGQRVYDMADLLGSSTEEELETDIEDARDRLGFDIVVVTTEDSEGRSSQDYADLFYEEGDFGSGLDKSGILFLIDMDNRELTLSTDGEAIRVFTDETIEKILDDVYVGVSRSDFEASVRVFLQNVKYYGEQAIITGQYNYDMDTGQVSVHRSIRLYELFIALAISGFVAGGACLSVKRQYNMELDDRQRNNLNMAYRADCRFAYDNQKDLLVNKYVTTKVIPRKSESSGGGFSSAGSGRRSGGGSSARRSTTHRSSSGRRHGGGSRKF